MYNIIALVYICEILWTRACNYAAYVLLINVSSGVSSVAHFISLNSTYCNTKYSGWSFLFSKILNSNTTSLIFSHIEQDCEKQYPFKDICKYV